MLIHRRNYSTLMAIIAGINKASIFRLKQSMKEMNPKYIKVLFADIAKRRTGAAYVRKRILQELPSKYSISISTLYTIYWYSTNRLYLLPNAVTYIEDGNPDTVDNLINFSKRELISKSIRELVEYQQLSYQIKPQGELTRLLQMLPAASDIQEKSLWSLSKLLE
jgi:hypothetical protein